jgi:hypothetical protein
MEGITEDAADQYDLRRFRVYENNYFNKLLYTSRVSFAVFSQS